MVDIATVNDVVSQLSASNDLGLSHSKCATVQNVLDLIEANPLFNNLSFGSCKVSSGLLIGRSSVLVNLTSFQLEWGYNPSSLINRLNTQQYVPGLGTIYVKSPARVLITTISLTEDLTITHSFVSGAGQIFSLQEESINAFTLLTV
jgi:hypothetical protein